MCLGVSLVRSELDRHSLDVDKSENDCVHDWQFRFKVQFVHLWRPHWIVDHKVYNVLKKNIQQSTLWCTQHMYMIHVNIWHLMNIDSSNKISRFCISKPRSHQDYNSLCVSHFLFLSKTWLYIGASQMMLVDCLHSLHLSLHWKNNC